MIDWHGADSLALQKELFLLVRLVFRTRQVTSCYIIAIDIYIDIDIDIDYLYRLIRCSCSTGLCRRRRSIISELSTLEWGLLIGRPTSVRPVISNGKQAAASSQQIISNLNSCSTNYLTYLQHIHHPHAAPHRNPRGRECNTMR